MFKNRSPPPEKKLWNLYESAKYESVRCGCQTGLSCVAKRAPWGRVVVVVGGLYSATR